MPALSPIRGTGTRAETRLALRIQQIDKQHGKACERIGQMYRPQNLLRVLCQKWMLAFGLSWTVLPGFAAPEGTLLLPANTDVWRIDASTYTHHYQSSPDYKDVWAVGLERESPDRTLTGVLIFSNSFGQPSAYAYYGHVFNNILDSTESLYLKLTVGVLYGYVPPYQDRVPLNYNGFSPGIIPGIGWRLDKNWSVQSNFLGLVGYMVMVSRQL
jgi:hypothetical protein